MPPAKLARYQRAAGDIANRHAPWGRVAPNGGATCAAEPQNLSCAVQAIGWQGTA
jgi:hypothetical protein